MAIDATALRLLDSWRKLAKLPSVVDHAKYLEVAAGMGLGSYQPEQIELVR